MHDKRQLFFLRSLVVEKQALRTLRKRKQPKKVNGLLLMARILKVVSARSAVGLSTMLR